MRDYTEIATSYAKNVLDGTIPACRQVQQACQRFLTDLAGDAWVYDADKAHFACGFIELLPHIKGELARKRKTLVLEPWQVFIIANLFGLVDARGLRKYREAFLLIPRKNGKSTLAAGIALFMAFMDGEAGAEVWIGANSMDQADAVFVPAKKMAELPALKEAAGLTVWAKSVEQPHSGSKLASQIGKPKDGTNPHCAILDEQHEAADATAYDAMKTGMGSRSQPLLLTITTAGVNLAGPCFLQQRYAEAVLNGDAENDRLFALIYTIDQDDDWRDFECWQKANPNFDVSVSESYLRAQHKEALSRPEKQAMARTKHCNEWVSSRSAWLNQADWARAGDDELLLEDCAGRPAWLGLDLATKTDIAALTARVALEDGRVALFPFLFLPDGALTRSKNAESYRLWADKGDLIMTDGEATDFSLIEDRIRHLCRVLEVKQIGFDPWQAHQLSQNLMADGLPVVECSANTKTFSPAMREFEAYLLDGTLVHPNNAAFNWMAGNVVAKADPRNNLYPRKPDGQPHLKIDGIVAALMAEAVAQNEPEPSGPPVVHCW